MVKDDIQELRVKLSGLTDENKRYVIAVAEALFFAQSNGESLKCNTGNTLYQTSCNKRE